MIIENELARLPQDAQQRFLINNRPASNFAALVIQQPQFWGYLKTKTGRVIDNIHTADSTMKRLLAITSKTDIDHDGFALYRFKLMFNDYRDSTV